jgi:hypothetical protein
MNTTTTLRNTTQTGENKMDIATLRKMRNTDFGKISQQFENIANPKSESNSYTDTRFWKLDPDKAGNASATIRFLPRTEGDDLPWVSIFSHGFQGPTGKWYIENSLTTIGEPDPVGELNSKLWNSTTDDNAPARKQARAQKRKLSYIANILVISDPKHPENNGKVFLFKFGKKIFDKIMDKARPTFEEDEPLNVFDLWEGADFKLRQKKVEGYPNYDQSVFESKSPIFGGDEDKILKVVNSQHKLSEFLDRKNFKSYEELSRKLAMVLNTEEKVTASQRTTAVEKDEEEFVQEVKKPTQQVKVSRRVEEEDDDDAISFFQKLANEA